MAFDITKQKQTEETLRHLSHRLAEVQEEERRAIARELHDQIGQYLTVLKILIGRIKQSGAKNTTSILGEADTVVNELISEVRNLSLNLRPSMLDDLGLLPTLLWHFERYTTQTKIRVNFKHAGLERTFPTALNTSAYRIVQEALTNVARHASVNQVSAQVWVEKEILRIRVEDHGLGFDPATKSTISAGLNGMSERTRLLGGKLTIETAPGMGTVVMAELPLQPSSKIGED